jgi:hypothetical protein
MFTAQVHKYTTCAVAVQHRPLKRHCGCATHSHAWDCAACNVHPNNRCLILYRECVTDGRAACCGLSRQ